jgi:hypothetical protein
MKKKQQGNLPQKVKFVQRLGNPRKGKTNFIFGAQPNPGMIKNSYEGSNIGFNKNARNYQMDKYICDLLDPWNAQDARLPAAINIFSNCAKVKSDFQLTCNASGNLFIYFDPDYCASATSGLTAFFFCNQTGLNGQTVQTGAVYNTGGTASVPIPPATTVLKYRLVSAAIKVTSKTSALNVVGTVFACFDYGDYVPTATTTATTVSTTTQEYTNFSNILNGNGGKKFDIGIGKELSSSIFLTWYPVDPSSAIFVDAGDFLIDSGSDEAGGDPKFVLGFQGFPASSTMDVQIIWNIEYLANPQAKAWIGMGGQGPPKVKALSAEEKLQDNTDKQITDVHEKHVPGQVYGEKA